MKINKVRIHCNDNEESTRVKDLLIEEFCARKILASQDSNEQVDLAIAIGGDGSFLRMVRAENFNSHILYVGINTGTLGFLPSVSKDDISEFVKCIENQEYELDKIPLQETIVSSKNGYQYFYSINEVVIRDKELKTLHARVKINNSLLENFSGDGILISTSIGSTAYNLSFGGAIVDRSIDTLQITPMAPLNNREYNNLLNSVVTSGNSVVKVLASDMTRGQFYLSFDGQAVELEDINRIITQLSGDIKVIAFNGKDYVKTINEKLLINSRR